MPKLVDEIVNLLEIATLRKELDKIEERRGRLPMQRERLEQRMKAFEKQHDVAKQRAEDARKNERKLEHEIQEWDEQLKRYRAQLLSAVSEREVESFNHQIDRLKSQIAEDEDRGLELLTATEAAEEEIKNTEQQIDKLLEEIDKETLRLDEKEAELTQAAEMAQAEYDNRHKTIDEEYADIWSRLEEKYSAGAIVPMARTGACGGCDMNLLTGTRDKVMSMRELTTCPSCGRVLYDSEHIDAKKMSAG